MTFSYLHLKLPWSGGIYPNPTVRQSSGNTRLQQTHARTHTLAHLHQLRKTEQGLEWVQGGERERAGRHVAGEEKEQRKGGTGTVCQSDAQSGGVHGVTHTTEPSVEATCLIMGNVCIWGRLWLAHPEHGPGKMARWQLLLHYVSKLYTLHAYTLHRGGDVGGGTDQTSEPRLSLNGVERFWKFVCVNFPNPTSDCEPFWEGRWFVACLKKYNEWWLRTYWCSEFINSVWKSLLERYFCIFFPCILCAFIHTFICCRCLELTQEIVKCSENPKLC